MIIMDELINFHKFTYQQQHKKVDRDAVVISIVLFLTKKKLKGEIVIITGFLTRKKKVNLERKSV